MTKYRIDDDVAAAAWKACRKQVFSLTDHTLNVKASSEFERGRCFEAEAIAKAMSSFDPADCDELAAAMGRTVEARPPFKTGDESLDELLEETWAWGSNSATGFRAHCWKDTLQDYFAEHDATRYIDRVEVRAIFMQHGFTVKPGETDLKPYVYAAAQALIEYTGKAFTRPREGCVHIVRPDGVVRLNVGSDNLSDQDRLDMQRNNEKEANRAR